jgi:hypothetical protein
MYHTCISCLNTGLSSTSHCHSKTIPNSWHVVYCLKTWAQFDFGGFPHHPLETITPKILNDPTSRNPVDLNQLSVEAKQVPTYPPTRKLSIQVAVVNGTEMCGSAIMHEVEFRRMVSGTSTKKSGMLFSRTSL